MATAGRWFDGEPEKPTNEEFEAHMKVERYYQWMGHRMALNNGRFDIRYEYGSPPMAVTEYGESEMTAEMYEEFGYVAVTNEDDEVVGWSSTPHWR